MNIRISTLVNEDYRRVFAQFNRDLFVRLSPPFPPVRLLRFDGSRVNDEVHLELNFLVRKEKWISVITDQQADAEEIYFVDEGRQLPFFFESWRHKHRIIRRGSQSLIVDDITFQCKWKLLNYIMLPFLYLQFLYRKPIYKRFFNQDVQPQKPES